MIDAKTFAALVRGTANLTDVAFEDLQATLEAFPYCRNLHDLLLMKSRQEERSDADALLERAASYSIDRPHLFERLQELDEYLKAEAEELALAEEVRSGSLGGAPAEDGPRASEAVPAAPPLPLARLARAMATALGTRPGPTPAIVSPAPTPPFRWARQGAELAGLIAYGAVLEQMPRAPGPEMEGGAVPTERKEPRPEPKRDFASWRRWLSRRSEVPEGKDGTSAAAASSASPKEDISAFAARSLLDNDEIVSETLAKVLVRQGRYGRALRVYQRLRLKYPEKSAYFAGIIQQLKNRQ